MPEAAAPVAAAPAAEVAPLPENASAAASAFVAKKEAAAKAPPKVEAKTEAKPEPAKTEKVKRIDPNLVKREREATEAAKRAASTEAKFAPLVEALKTRNLRKALTIMAEEHGVEFKDFVEVLKGGDEDETPAQTAERIAAAAIEKAEKARAAKEAEEAKERDAQLERDINTRIEKVRADFQAAAENDPDRWELTAIGGHGGEAWDLIDAHYAATTTRDDKGRMVKEGEKLSRDQALDLIEGKLRAKRDAVRAKSKGAQTGSATGTTRSEADGQVKGGRAEEPSSSNRTTSGAPAVIPKREPGEVRFDNRAIDDAIERAGLRHRV